MTRGYAWQGFVLSAVALGACSGDRSTMEATGVPTAGDGATAPPAASAGPVGDAPMKVPASKDPGAAAVESSGGRAGDGLDTTGTGAAPMGGSAEAEEAEATSTPNVEDDPADPGDEPAEMIPADILDPVVTVVLDADLDQPTDLEFNPNVDDELWIMNYGDSSATVVSNASTSEPSAQHRRDVEGPRHFMPSPTAFAFGGPETTIVDADGQMVEGTFATCPGVDRPFMGPTLWPSDLRIFAISKSDREAPFNGRDTGFEGPGSHLDMLHRTPACTGIAWEGTGNVYWSYSGSAQMFVKYDFASDHGIGNADHSDGSVWRYPVEGIRHLPSVPGHLAYDTETKLVYMTDPGMGRVVVFDPESAGGPADMRSTENVDRLAIAKDIDGGELRELVPASFGLLLPSGLEIHAQRLYVSDHEASTIHKFSMDGTHLGQVELSDEVERSGLAGMAFGADDKLYFVDMVGERVLRLENEF